LVFWSAATNRDEFQLPEVACASSDFSSGLELKKAML
jgi:hypothetical protein